MPQAIIPRNRHVKQAMRRTSARSRPGEAPDAVSSTHGKEPGAPCMRSGQL